VRAAIAIALPSRIARAKSQTRDSARRCASQNAALIAVPPAFVVPSTVESAKLSDAVGARSVQLGVSNRASHVPAAEIRNAVSNRVASYGATGPVVLVGFRVKSFEPKSRAVTREA
jgi:hypothetical protein